LRAAPDPEVPPPDAPRAVAPSPSPSRPDLAGSGSPTHPFVISWPLLMAPQRPDAPTDAVDLPESITSLDGASVQISGFLAPPVQVETTRELLVMRNRWDGCCIGTPPTPYDCVEVSLAEPVAVRGKHLIQFGTVRGRLRVEPFLAGRFLLGLYRIEDGSVEGFGN